MSWLLDPDVICQPAKRNGDAKVIAWLETEQDRMFSNVVDQSVRFGQKKLLALRIEFRGARERELASIRTNALSKNGLALLTVPRRFPFANVQNQDTSRSKRASERSKNR